MTRRPKAYLYIDESGNEGLDLGLPCVSSHYVVCALVLESRDIPAATQRFEEIRSRYFRSHEMKSESVTDEIKRQVILQEITSVPFSLHVLVGNKKLLVSAGLRYPKSFIKYFQGNVYQAVLKDNPRIHIRADEIKNPQFMREFREYLDRKNILNLFTFGSFEFVDSKQDLCVQVADFLGGTIRRCFERNSLNPMTDPAIEKLRGHIVHWMPFPESYGNYVANLPGAHPHDQMIESRAVMEGVQFLEKHGDDDDPERVLQVAAVRLLLSAARNKNEDYWVPTGKLMEFLNFVAPDPISEQSLRHVIGRLRDEGLLIASRSAGGYKLPTGLSDLTEFLNRQNSQLAPMISRVRIARETVKRATNGALDILSEPAFSNLKCAIDSAPHWSEASRHMPDLKDEPSTANLDLPLPSLAETLLVHAARD